MSEPGHAAKPPRRPPGRRAAGSRSDQRPPAPPPRHAAPPPEAARPPFQPGKRRAGKPPAPPPRPVAASPGAHAATEPDPLPTPSPAPSQPARARRPHLPRPLRWGLAGLGVLVVAGYAALCILAGDKVPAGASVAGVEIGGLHASAAEQRLRETIGKQAEQPIEVTGAGQTAAIPASKTGMSLDIAQSVRDAGGGSSYLPGRLWRYYTGRGDDHDAAVNLDAKPFDAAVATVIATIGKKVAQGTLTFDHGHPVTHEAAAGRDVTTSDARAALLRALGRQGPTSVRWTTVEPTVTDAAVSRAKDVFADPATSGPVVLVLDGHRIVAPPALFTQAITMQPDHDGALRPKLDVDDLMSALEPVMAGVAGTPRPATYEIVDGHPRIVPSRIGITFDRSVLRAKFLDAAIKARPARRLVVKGVSAQPSFTTADARRMRITRKVAGDTTPFGYSEYRNVNLARAAVLLDGTVVQPGQTFSLESAVGRPDEKNGFMPGFEIDGGVFRPDPGAGLSQVASTLFSAMFAAGLKDAGHEVTTVYTGRYPLGQEASFEYGKDDMSFTNNTPYGVLIKVAVTPSSTSGDGRLQIQLWSTKTWDVQIVTSKPYARQAPAVVHQKGAGCDARTGYAGFSVDVTRIFRKPGQTAIDHKQRTTTVYRPSNSVICDP